MFLEIKRDFPYVWDSFLRRDNLQVPYRIDEHGSLSIVIGNKWIFFDPRLLYDYFDSWLFKSEISIIDDKFHPSYIDPFGDLVWLTKKGWKQPDYNNSDKPKIFKTRRMAEKHLFYKLFMETDKICMVSILESQFFKKHQYFFDKNL